MTTKDVLTLAVAGAGAAVALLTLIRGVVEYRRQGRQKRSEQFFALRQRLKQDKSFMLLAGLLDDGILGGDIAKEANVRLAEVPFALKREYLGVYEEVALAMHSGLIKPQVAHYMFGYYAILCWESDAFWKNVNRLSNYWSLFDDFCQQMKEESEDFKYRRRDFRV